MGDKLAKAPGIKQGASFFADYRKFMDRGNVIDLAVAVIVGMWLIFVRCCLFKNLFNAYGAYLKFFELCP